MDLRLSKSLSGSYCACCNISYNEIAIFIRNIKSIKDLTGVHRYFALRENCKICKPDIQKIIEFYNKQT